LLHKINKSSDCYEMKNKQKKNDTYKSARL